MNELAQALRRSRDPWIRLVRPELGEDRAWLAIMAATIAVELAWWSAAWNAGIAPAPLLGTYLLLAFAGLSAALAGRVTLGLRPICASWQSVFLATLLVGVGASLFLPLKYAIPHEIPFWLDAPLAAAERKLFTADPWLLLDRLSGWTTKPLDRIYGLWLPMQSLVLFALILEPPSPAKSRALLAYSLAWFLLGVAAATLFSSAGPIFYDRLFGGDSFASLRETLRTRGAWVVLAESDGMWRSIVSGRPGLVAGISAVPSMHIAISVWMFLTARSMAPKTAPFALSYAILMWVGSVQLGWHYASDGLAGALGMLVIWRLAGALQKALRSAPIIVR